MKVLNNVLIVAMTATSLSFGMGMVAPVEGYAASKAYCRSYARDRANHKAGVKQVVTGAAVGAGVGALAGAVIPGLKVGTGALVGAGVGTLGGGINANKKWKRVYNESYAYCRQEM